MSAATHESLLQAARTVIQTALSLTDNQIIVADDKGPRPDLPYLTVGLNTYDVPLSQDRQDWPESSGGDVDVASTGQREGTISLQGYGRGSSQWLTELPHRLHRRAVQAAMTTQGIDLQAPDTGVIRLGQLVETALEDRYSRDLRITYRDTGATENVPAVDTVGLTGPSDDVLTTTITL